MRTIDECIRSGKPFVLWAPREGLLDPRFIFLLAASTTVWWSESPPMDGFGFPRATLFLFGLIICFSIAFARFVWNNPLYRYVRYWCIATSAVGLAGLLLEVSQFAPQWDVGKWLITFAWLSFALVIPFFPIFAREYIAETKSSQETAAGNVIPMGQK